MERLLEVNGYNSRRHSTRRIPGADGAQRVGEGYLQLGSSSQIYVSDAFLSCSAFLLRGNNPQAASGLFHVRPRPLGQRSRLEDLAKMGGGRALTISGSNSTPKYDLLAELYTDYGIEFAGEIPVETGRVEETSNINRVLFHVVYNAGVNEVFVADNWQNRLRRYRAF